MSSIKNLLPLLLLALSAQCAPITTLSTIALTAIAPSSTTCAGAAFPSECRTAAQALDPLQRSFQTYAITAPAEQAALLALIAYESGDFKYAANHWPGVPGQGTRNMQSPAFNAKYATALYGAGAVAAAQAQGGPAGVLALLAGDAESFGSAAWFLATQCGQDVRRQLQMGTLQGWEAYLTGCVGTTATQDRVAYWERAVRALGVSHT